jgi:hypothetical protein
VAATTPTARNRMADKPISPRKTQRIIFQAGFFFFGSVEIADWVTIRMILLNKGLESPFALNVYLPGLGLSNKVHLRFKILYFEKEQNSIPNYFLSILLRDSLTFGFIKISDLLRNWQAFFLHSRFSCARIETVNVRAVQEDNPHIWRFSS